MSNSISLKFAYNNTDFTRTYKLDNVPTSALSTAKSKIASINSILDGTITGQSHMIQCLRGNFVANEYDNGLNSTGHMSKISEATIVQESVTKIPLFG